MNLVSYFSSALLLKNFNNFLLKGATLLVRMIPNAPGFVFALQLLF